MAQIGMTNFPFDPVTGQATPRSFDEVIASRLNAATPQQYAALTEIANPPREQPVMRRQPEPGWMGEDLGPGQITDTLTQGPPQPPRPDPESPGLLRRGAEVASSGLFKLAGQEMPQPSPPGAAPAVPAPSSPPSGPGAADGGLPTDGGLTYGGDSPGVDPQRLTDELWERDTTKAPTGQPRREQVQVQDAPGMEGQDPLADALRGAGATGLPYSTPDQRAQPGPPAEGMALATPNTATRTTGSTGNPAPQAEASAQNANQMNWVQRKAAEWFGIDTPEERQDAKTYLAHWAAGMANSTNGLGSFADANLAGLTAVQEQDKIEAGLELKREEFNARREEEAYRRTRDAAQDERQARMDEYRIDEYQAKAEERRRAREAARNNPLAGTALEGGRLEALMQIRELVDAQYPDASPEEKEQIAQQLFLTQFPPKSSGDAWLEGLMEQGG